MTLHEMPNIYRCYNCDNYNNHYLWNGLRVDISRRWKWIWTYELLGSACSGKSTFTKQLRILYGDGYPVEERAALRPLVIDNIGDGMKLIIDHMKAKNISFQNPNNEVIEWHLQVRLITCKETLSTVTGDKRIESHKWNA